VEEAKFIVDGMLLGLGRWMRFLGCDVLFFLEKRKSMLVRIARSEKRIVLTRDTRFFQDHPEISVYISGENIKEQLREIRRRFLPENQPERYLTRCSLCNQLLIMVEKEYVRSRVPPYVFDNHHQFRTCPVCQRIYWEGDHTKRIKEVLNSLWEEK